MKDKIITELKNIEEELGVKLLLASYYGSRSYGFHMENSDHDICFIYCFTQDRYLSVDQPKDSINREVFIDGIKVELSGWELRKTLNLTMKSNISIMELLGNESHILSENGFERDLAHLFIESWDGKKIMTGLLGQIHSYRKRCNYLNESLPPKELLHLIRLFLTGWQISDGSAIPLSGIISKVGSKNKEILNEVKFAIKNRGNENWETIPISNYLQQWMQESEEMMIEAKDSIYRIKTSDEEQKGLANTIFRKYINAI